jgi:hypothetical protein
MERQRRECSNGADSGVAGTAVFDDDRRELLRGLVDMEQCPVSEGNSAGKERAMKPELPRLPLLCAGFSVG